MALGGTDTSAAKEAWRYMSNHIPRELTHQSNFYVVFWSTIFSRVVREAERLFSNKSQSNFNHFVMVPFRVSEYMHRNRRLGRSPGRRRFISRWSTQALRATSAFTEPSSRYCPRAMSIR